MARLTLNGMYEYDNTLFEGMVLPPDYDTDALFFEIMNRSGQLYPYHQSPVVLKSAIRLWFARNYLNFDRTMEALTAEYNPIENYDRHEWSKREPDLKDETTRVGDDKMIRSGNDTVNHTGDDTINHTGDDTMNHTGDDTLAYSKKDTTTHDYTDSEQPYKETLTESGGKTTEEQVSAYDSGAYQPSKKTIETFGAPSTRKDTKEITGIYEDTISYGHEEKTTFNSEQKTTYDSEQKTTYDSEEKTTYDSTDTNRYGSTFTDRHTGNEEYTAHMHGNIGTTSNQDMVTWEINLRKFDVYTDIAARFEHEFIVQVY